MTKTYYPLTHDEFIQRSSELKDAQLRVYLYLMTLNPFPDSVMEIDTARISEHLELTRRTIQRAIKRLQELQLIEIEVTKFKYKKVVHGSSSRLGSGDPCVAKGDPCVAKGDPCVAKGDPCVAKGDPCVAKGDPCVAKGDPYVAANDTRIVSNDTRIASTPLKPLSDMDCKTPHTYKHSYFINSLSEGERESFLNFVNKKIAELPKPPTLPNKWIEANFGELRNLWEKQTNATGSEHCEAVSSTKELDFENWEDSRHQGQYFALTNRGLAKFCENPTSKAWYEWAVVKHPHKFVDIPS